MLRAPTRGSAGFSVIELAITLALIAILMVLVLPSIGKWTADAHTRAAAESLTTAIRQTQSTAVARGRTSLFALTSATPPVVTSTPAANSPNWFSEINPMGGSDETQSSPNILILKSTEGTQHGVTISDGPALLCFNALGRLTTLTSGANSLGTACSASNTYYTVSRTNATRSFRVYVYAGGRVRMCDAAKTLSATNPDGC